MRVGISTFQPAHIEIDLAVGQTVQKRSMGTEHESSSVSIVNDASSISIGGASSGCSSS